MSASTKLSRRFLRTRLVFWSALLHALIAGWFFMIRMPGQSYRGTPPPLTADELLLRSELRADVSHLAGAIGERNLARYPKLQEAADFIESELRSAGWQVRRDEYEVQGKRCANSKRSPRVALPGSS